MKEINLSQEKTIIVEPAKTITTNKINLKGVWDSGKEVIAHVVFEKDTKEIILWDSTQPIEPETQTSYEKIGVWTDDDVASRLNELL